MRDKTYGSKTGDTDNLFDCSDNQAVVAPVGSYQPNAWGLYDMTGNVWEWTASKYVTDYDGSESVDSTRDHDECSTPPLFCQRKLGQGRFSAYVFPRNAWEQEKELEMGKHEIIDMVLKLKAAAL